MCFGHDLKTARDLLVTIHLPPVSRVRLTIQFSGAGIRTIGLTRWDAITPTEMCISSSAMFPCSVSIITNCDHVCQEPPDRTERIDKTRLTSNPICAIILAREAPGNMSQEPTIQIKEVTMRIVCPVKRKRRVRLTHDRLLRLPAVLEEPVKSKVAGGHSGGILMWDPPATEGRRLYSSWCGPDPPDHFPF